MHLKKLKKIINKNTTNVSLNILINLELMKIEKDILTLIMSFILKNIQI